MDVGNEHRAWHAAGLRPEGQPMTSGNHMKYVPLILFSFSVALVCVAFIRQATNTGSNNLFMAFLALLGIAAVCI